jgi:hypothetical protein
LIAVGRVAASSSQVSASAASEASRARWMARPQAAVAPISGAPRTHISRIAAAASSRVASGTVTKACGSRRWSMIRTVPSGSVQIERVGRPSTFMLVSSMSQGFTIVTRAGRIKVGDSGAPGRGRLGRGGRDMRTFLTALALLLLAAGAGAAQESRGASSSAATSTGRAAR